MRRVRTRIGAGLAAAGLALAPGSAAAQAGGTQAPERSGGAGGAQYGAPLGAPAGARPVARRFWVRPGRIALRIDENGAQSVHARLVFWPLGGGAQLARIDLGAVTTNALVRPRWPDGLQLTPGRYLVRLHVRDQWNHTLRRRAHATGRTVLTVAAPKPVVPPGPMTKGVFPVAGAHSFGDRFGAPRAGYSHQGQDVLGAEGTPIVSPTAGTVTFTDYQKGGAGYYVVEHAADGRDFFFAHCQEGSVAVKAGDAVAPGTPLCGLGHTGDASGPHLHFEIWENGWRTGKDSRPIDPLPQLQMWDGGP